MRGKLTQYGVTGTDATPNPIRAFIRMAFGFSNQSTIDELLSRLDAQDVLINTLTTNLEALQTEFNGINLDFGQLPIGTLIEIDSTTTDMNAFMGYGSWELYGIGRSTICAGTGTDSNSTAIVFANGAIGGEYTHGLTAAENGVHSHKVPLTYPAYAGRKDGQAWPAIPTIGTVGDPSNISSEDQGSSTKHNTLHPYVVVSRWKRVG